MLLLETLITDTHIGISLGTLLGVVCSWERNRSILWALIHAFLGWIYVIYYALTRWW